MSSNWRSRNHPKRNSLTRVGDRIPVYENRAQRFLTVDRPLFPMPPALVRTAAGWSPLGDRQFRRLKFAVKLLLLFGRQSSLPNARFWETVRSRVPKKRRK